MSRYQDNSVSNDIPSSVKSISGRINLIAGNFTFDIEAVTKDSDILANEGELISNKLYDGTAIQIDLGYSIKGLGINSSLRRLENFNFYSNRLAEGNIYNQQSLSYTPALTKQQDYLLTNIYVYNSQPRLVINSLEKRSGEVGSQTDLYYSFKKEPGSRI